MIEKSGKTLTISEILKIDEDEYSVEEMGFVWTNEMFEEVPVPDCTAYINTSSDSCNPYWQPLRVDDFGKISRITMTVDDMKKSIEKENKKMNCKDLLNIYFNRMEKRILEEKRNKEKEIKENDKIQKLLEDTENQINVMLDRDEERRYCLPTIYTYTDETDKALIENEKETDRKIEELYQLKAEVEAQLSIIPEDKYEVAVEVLKNYEILDEKGRINA